MDGAESCTMHEKSGRKKTGGLRDAGHGEEWRKSPGRNMQQMKKYSLKEMIGEVRHYLGKR